MKKLSIVIPVYNEEERVEKSLKSLFEYLQGSGLDYELLIVDDGSVDNTLAILSEYEPWIKIIPLWPNQGKGSAVRSGVMAASGDYILFMDADLATSIEEISRFFQMIDQANIDIIIGSRSNEESRAKRTPFRWLAGVVFRFLSKSLLGLEFSDTQCGFKIFTKAAAISIFSRMKIERWAFDLEVLFLAQKLQFNVMELGVIWEEKSGSKVRFVRDAARMIKDIFKILYFNFSGSYNYLIKEGESDEIYQKAELKKL